MAYPCESLNNINTPLHGRRAEAFDMSVDGAHFAVVGGRMFLGWVIGEVGLHGFPVNTELA